MASHTHRSTASGRAAAFISGLDEILLIAALIALVAGALALLLIRQRDFVAGALAAGDEPEQAPAVTGLPAALSEVQ